jgi:molybdate transport system substrate-binding protein
MMRGFIPSLALALAVLCGGPARADITVFAAASLKTALDRIASDWQAQGGEAVVLAYGGSSALARQIEAGAPADAFLSASEDWMDWLDGRNLLAEGSRRDLLGNALVLVAPGAATAGAVTIGPDTDLRALLGDGVLAMALADSVPAGVYARQSLTTLGLWDGVAPQVAQAADVRAALALVARGEAALGIVYATDAAAEPRVHVVGLFPEDSHDPITYPVARIAGAAADATAFLDYLRSDPARAVFTAQGFTLKD